MSRIDLRPLSCLLDEMDLIYSPPLNLPRVSGIVIDSRKVQADSLYIAIPGTRVDGHDFIFRAVEKGAAAVVGSKPAELYQDLPVPYLQAADPRDAAAIMAAAWYGYPARQLVVVGVTGTDGKTTTVNLIYEILQSAGVAVGLVSTVNARIGDQVLDTGFHVTTPEALDIQYYLREMVSAGVTHVVLEATSHGLAQKRVETCEFDLGVVTNITHEHLDYHGSYEEYFEAKARLFALVAAEKEKDISSRKLAVINRDDGSYPALRERLQQLNLSLIDYGITKGADFAAREVRSSDQGVSFQLLAQGVTTDIHTPLRGDYNLYNILAAAAVCVEGLGVDWESVQAGASRLDFIPGRMEKIDLGQTFTAIVDFAHTPNALREALKAARKLTGGKVIAVFGSAGLRDRQKRRMMAEVSAKLADTTILTAEDPRTESLAEILQEMADGMRSLGMAEGSDFWRVEDRGEAIRLAVSQAEEGDLVIVCGKGHEQSMCFGETEYPWDDRTATRAALAEHLGMDGPEMPFLPTQGKRG